MTTELYKKIRPQSFDEMIGNEHTIESLKTMIANDKLPHTILFSGPSGTGKTTIARILAQELGCTESDIQELNMSHQDLRGIGGANEITSSIGFKSLSGQKRVLILDEVDNMTSDAQKLMKKPLEDTPSHIYFFLCTTRPEKIIRDIITRSTHIELEAIDRRTLGRYLKTVTLKETGKELLNSVSLKIAEKAEGSVRKALVFLEQVLTVDTEEGQLELIKKITLDEDVDAIELCRALMNKARWEQVSDILQRIKAEPEQVRQLILAYFNKVLLSNGSPRAGEILLTFQEPLYNWGKAGLTYLCYELSQ